MIPNSMMRFPPPPVERPYRMWKSLGMVGQGTSGYVEAHYALETFGGDFGIDKERELHAAAQHLGTMLTQSGENVDPDKNYVLARRDGNVTVRFRQGEWNKTYVANATPA